MTTHKHILGGALLVTGTSVGAGMLALPIVTGLSGFIPSIFTYIICYIVMTATGLLYLEVCLNMPKDSNVISLTDTYLGKKYKIFSWIIYLFLFYCLSVAYIAGAGNMIHVFSNNSIPLLASLIGFVLIFGSFIYKGALTVDRMNLFLVAGLFISYIAFVFLGASHINTSFLKDVNLKQTFFALPVILISFGYQGLIPTLTTYLNKDAKSIRKAIILGTTLTLIIYIIWEMLILGIIPMKGVHGLIEANKTGASAIEPLKYHTNIPSIYIIGQFFGFFAITTSFLGVNLGLFDFLSDGLKIPKKGIKKLLLAVITFLPPLLITISYPHIFLKALDFAGGIGGVLLLVLLPTMMVWKERYVKKSKIERQLPFGKTALIAIFIFVVIELGIKFYKDIF
jgi:tyrosine-specific transport protein